MQNYTEISFLQLEEEAIKKKRGKRCDHVRIQRLQRNRDNQVLEKKIFTTVEEKYVTSFSRISRTLQISPHYFTDLSYFFSYFSYFLNFISLCICTVGLFIDSTQYLLRGKPIYQPKKVKVQGLFGSSVICRALISWFFKYIGIDCKFCCYNFMWVERIMCWYGKVARKFSFKL